MTAGGTRGREGEARHKQRDKREMLEGRKRRVAASCRPIEQQGVEVEVRGVEK